MGNLHTLLFYKFVDIEEPEKFVSSHLDFCKRLGMLGRILVGKEGINGSVCGTKEQVDEYKNELKGDARFADVVFKEDIGESACFTKMRVILRDEIIAIRKKIDMSMKAPYISSKELKKLYENGEDFIILDTRNDYEWKVGKFRDARVLPIKSFREFPEAIDGLKNDLKGKKIVTYCTGGIRCEKATSYMKEAGFEDVYQLKDGIINFCKDFPDSFWEGDCFVFDKRMIENYNSDNKSITECEICGGVCDLYRNCKYAECDRFVVLCVSCEKEMNGCCSAKCLVEFKEYCGVKARVNQGRKSVDSQAN